MEQDSLGNSSHCVQIPLITNRNLCPVLALHELVDSRSLIHTCPLFIHNNPPFHPVIDTTITDGLSKVLTRIGIPLTGYRFHTFRRSSATLAYDNNTDLQHIMVRGMWTSLAFWTYLPGSPLPLPL